MASRAPKAHSSARRLPGYSDPACEKEEAMGTIGKAVISLVVLAAVGAFVAYEAPRLVKVENHAR